MSPGSRLDGTSPIKDVWAHVRPMETDPALLSTTKWTGDDTPYDSRISSQNLLHTRVPGSATSCSRWSQVKHRRVHGLVRGCWLRVDDIHPPPLLARQFMIRPKTFDRDGRMGYSYCIPGNQSCTGFSSYKAAVILFFSSYGNGLEASCRAHPMGEGII